MMIAEKLERSFGQNHVLKGVSAAFPPGLNVIVGRSGSGKTTLMNLLSGIDLPDSGRVTADGIVLSALSERERDDFRRKNLGFVFQSVALIGSLSAEENVKLALKLAGKKPRPVGELFERLGIAGKEKRLPASLSGGEQQRVAIARAIAHEPRYLFADEPTAQLDLASAEKIAAVFHTLAKEKEITVIMTTHDPALLAFADRVYRMNDGRIEAEHDTV